MKITRAQAAAFADAIAGYETVGVDSEGAECVRARSPQALAHLEAVFGRGGVPSGHDVANAGPRGDMVPNWRTPRVLALADYLESVATELRDATKPAPK